MAASTSMATDGESSPVASELARTDRLMLLLFLAVRAVHVTQGAICVTSGWRSYRRRRLVGVTLGVAASESAWLAWRGLRDGALDRKTVAVDTATSIAGLLALGAGTSSVDRTTSLNWMLPYSVGATIGVGLASPRRIGAPQVGAMALTYALTTLPSSREAPGVGATALANMASYVGFFAVVEGVKSFLTRTSTELDEARRQAVQQGVHLATERERNRQYRLIHDSALQTLEAVGRGSVGDDALLRVQARREATRLRRVLTQQEPLSHDLLGALAQAAEELEDAGVRVEVVADPIDQRLAVEVATALAQAAREALENVAKHAQTRSVVVRVQPATAGVEVVVRDHGVGFDRTAGAQGFGTSQSIIGRMADVGGRAEVWSQPGRGTRVTLWGPA